MSKRILWIGTTVLIAIFLLYISRFWVFELWSREGLFGIKQLPPKGGLLARWLRGTPLAPFELLIWFSTVFMVLTWIEWLYTKLNPSD